MDWQSLLHQSEELVTQDYHEFPRVSRNIEQLHQYAEGLRARTRKYRSLSDQNASTRLLAQQGFDSTRLAQDVSMLEVRPTVEDVFDGGVTSVEEYLKQIEESTILSAIQDAQRDTVASFDCYMEDCMSRDWAANKRQLFSIIAPHTGAVAAPTTGGTLAASQAQPAGGLLIGVTPRQAGASAGGASAATAAVTAGLGQSVSAKEAAYNEVLVRWSQAAAASASRQQLPAPDLLREFSVACKSKDDQATETSMSACWSLLVDILGEAKARGVPAQPAGRFTEALLSGARKNLERGHVAHMRTTIHRHKVAAERGPDPDPLREVQAYVLLKVGTARGPLDFQQPGGHDTSWLQVFFCLRNGWHDAARRAAERTQDVVAGRLGDVGFKALLDEWLRNGGRLGDRTVAVLVRDVDRLLRDKAALKGQLRQPYLVLLCALLAGYAHALDALTAALSQLQVASVLTTLEDFMWAKLTVVNLQGGSGPSQAPTSAADHYSLERLQADLNRWPASYYSKQGKEPLLYVTVLLLSLQFQAALKFLWKDETARQYRVDAVHLAIAMHTEGLLKLPSSEPGPDVGSILHSYGRKFVHSSSHLALAYYMLAAAVKGGGLAVKGHMLRELLSESGDFGSLLGGGGAAGAGGPLAAYMPDVEERKRLFEAVAYECQAAAQPAEAVELYMAADRPRQALAVLNAQLSAALQRAVEEQAGAGQAGGNTAARDAVVRVMARGRDARQRITVAGDAPPAITGAAGPSTPSAGRSPGPDAGARLEVEAFDQLCVIYDLLLANLKGRHDMALQKLAELPFVPLEHARVAACIRAATQLHSSVQERLPDVLSAAADAIGAAARAGSSGGGGGQRILRGQLDALLTFANSVSHRLSKGVYQKLCETAAKFA